MGDVPVGGPVRYSPEGKGAGPTRWTPVHETGETRMTRSDGKRIRRRGLPGLLTLAVAIGWSMSMSAAAHADCALGQVCAPTLPSVLPSTPANRVANDGQNAVDQGRQAANGAVQQVNDTVNKVLNPGGGDGGGPGGGGSGGGSNQGTGNGSLPAGTSGGTSSGGTTAQPNAAPAAHQSASHGIAGAIGRAAASVGFPLILAVLVIAFVALQRRLDRKDPRLALARSEPDTVRFL